MMMMMMMTLTRVQMKPEMSKLFAKVYMFNFSLRHPVSLLYTVDESGESMEPIEEVPFGKQRMMIMLIDRLM